MEIKFLKDYKKYKKGEIISKNNIVANKLIGDGYAEYVEKSYKIQDLFVAPIIEPTHKFLVSHIGNTRHIGIFTREVYGFVKTFPKYTHIITNKTFINNYSLEYEDYEIQKAGLVVDELKMQTFSEKFFEKMLKNGWRENSRISIKDITELENELNGIVNTKQNNEREC